MKRSVRIICVLIVAAVQLREFQWVVVAFIARDASPLAQQQARLSSTRHSRRRPQQQGSSSVSVPGQSSEVHDQKQSSSGVYTRSFDEMAIEEQLGYVPSNFVKVTARTATKGNKPVAIQTYPLNGGAVRRRNKAKGAMTPFPTLYWLSCPDISRAVADLERRGSIGVLEKRLRSKEEHTKMFIAAHTAYAEERWRSLTKEDRDMMDRVMMSGDATDYGDENRRSVSITKGMVDMIRFSGIAGRARPFEPCIKCLHSHYAHYRSGGELNVVGMWTDELLREQFPELDL